MRNEFSDWLITLEISIQLLAGIAGILTLGYAIYQTLLAQKRPTGTTTGAATSVLCTPYLVIATIIFCFGSYIFWQPLPIQMHWAARIILMLVGAAVFFPSLALYLWGLRSLGVNFNASSGFGVRLIQSHQLVICGPYARIRHPMYLAVILACWGGLLIYLTWTMLILAPLMLGLIIRARREDEALALEFGEAWQQYQQCVPGWFPRLKI